MASELGYYRHPTIHDDSIAFICEDDLWTVPVQGGSAVRLTTNPGTASFPSLSPDGRRIAFTGRDEGHPEVYTIDHDGGAARRITWLGGLTQVVGWSHDGSEILFASDWRQQFRNYVHLWSVPFEGGRPRALQHGPARAVSYESDGPGVVIGRNSGDPARWKRYRGGTAGTLWCDRGGKGGFAPLLRLSGNLANPMWIGGRIYFLSDHEGVGNIYSCTPTGRGLRRHTDHADYYVRFPSTDGRRIVYHAGADLFVFDPGSGVQAEVPVRVPSSRSQRSRKFVSPTKYLETFDLHPKGHSLATVHRGGVYSMGLWEGAVRRNDPESGDRYRLGRWLPDGKRIVAITDEGGEESISLLRGDGHGTIKQISGDFGRAIDLLVAPAGAERVALTNQRQELVLVDLRDGKIKIVDHSPFDRVQGVSWSADGRWLAYGYANSARTSSIRLFDSRRGGKVTEVTPPDFRDAMPSFDFNGRYLYFISDRVFDPVPDGHYFDFSFPKGSKPMMIPLRADIVSPFSRAHRQPRPPGSQSASREESKKDVKKPVPVEIDLDGIADRILAFPVPEGRYGRILGAPGRALFSSFPIEGRLNVDWLDSGAPPAKGKIEAYDYDKSKTELVGDQISDFKLSIDARTLAIRSGNRIRVVPSAHKSNPKPGASERPGRESGWVDLGRVRVSVVPAAEWRQMFREAWRLQRDQFWTPTMSGIDWTSVYERYFPLVDRVASRSEYSDLLWEMQGELGTSHCYEMGGDYRPEPAWYRGFLGADIEFQERRKAWRITKILRGDSWEDRTRSPLAAPGLDVKEGDEILAVGGKPVGKETSPYERLVHFAGQEVQITLRAPRGSGRSGGKGRGQTGAPRKITVQMLRSEYPIRYRAWVEENRRRVHEETGGRIGYVHIPDMGAVGFSEFHRYFPSEVNREGLIVDVRWNGGGNVSQLVLEKLLRKRIGYDATRWGQPESYPVDAPMGPMVALTNEYAGSDGDIFSHSFKLYGLGPLIGKRTWGGVVGIWPRHMLVDGTVTTQPEFAFWFRDVGWGVENYGTDPDIEVEIRPQDHAEGRDTQLERGIAETMKIIRKVRPSVPELRPGPRVRTSKVPKKAMKS